MKKVILISILSYLVIMSGIITSVYFLGECNHNLVKTEFIAATCTEDGNEEYWECLNCGKKFSDENAKNMISNTAIAAQGHKLDKMDYKAETCTENGNIEYWECSVCNNKYSDESAETEITQTVIYAGHKLDKTEYKAATCTENGNIEYWECSVCNNKYSDESAETEITQTVIYAGHKYGEYVYDYDTNRYVRTCSCGSSEYEDAGGEKFPILANSESVLASIAETAGQGAYIKLANDIEITAGSFEFILRLPENGTLDLGGYTVTVKNHMGFIIEGTGITLCNGSFVTGILTSYALFIGDEGDNNSVSVINISTVGGINVYNCEAVFYDCNVEASEYTYYALWADEHSTITVESGNYSGGKTACVHSTANADPEGCGYVVINGGTFKGKIMATYRTDINGGEFDSDIVLTNYKIDAKLVVNKNYVGELNIVVSNAQYDKISSVDENGNFVYETKLKEEN